MQSTEVQNYIEKFTEAIPVDSCAETTANERDGGFSEVVAWSVCGPSMAGSGLGRAATVVIVPVSALQPLREVAANGREERNLVLSLLRFLLSTRRASSSTRRQLVQLYFHVYQLPRYSA